MNDERVLMMTGAQYLMLALIVTGLWIFLRVRKSSWPPTKPPA